MPDNKSDNSSSPRRRSLTSLTLNWLADRMRKAERLKSAVESGEYRVNSEDLARIIVARAR